MISNTFGSKPKLKCVAQASKRSTPGVRLSMQARQSTIPPALQWLTMTGPLNSMTASQAALPR